MSTYLGLDSSTQSLSAILIDLDARETLLEVTINYDQRLPEFKTEHGVLPGKDPAVAHSDPLLWVAALDLLSAEPERRRRLHENADFLRSALLSLGFRTLPGGRHILPILVGDDARAEAMRNRVLEGGVFVQAIRPPAVPEGSSRLRIAPTAGHTQAQLERAIDVLARAGRECGLVGSP